MHWKYGDYRNDIACEGSQSQASYALIAGLCVLLYPRHFNIWTG